MHLYMGYLYNWLLVLGLPCSGTPSHTPVAFGQRYICRPWATAPQDLRYRNLGQRTYIISMLAGL